MTSRHEPSVEQQLSRAAAAIGSSRHLLIAAGAGMGVDSGLPDFRGAQGFWRAYPAFERLGLRFEQLADARWFDEDPHLAWGFYGHRLNLYRATRPHAGFEILLTWARARRERGGDDGGGGRDGTRYFVFTSNVDGQFQAAGFPSERIVECHGSIHHLQCAARCSDAIWFNDSAIDLDEQTMRARDPLPQCPRCGGVARPNVLMFGGDSRWVEERAEEQTNRYWQWMRGIDGGTAVIECGGGTAVPSVRQNSHWFAKMTGATLVRINPREPDVPHAAGDADEGGDGGGGRHVGLAMSSLDALRAISTIVGR